MYMFLTLNQAGKKVAPDLLGSLTSDRRIKMIGPREITLALISKRTLVKLAQTSNSFGLKKPFFVRSEVSDPTCSTDWKSDSFCTWETLQVDGNIVWMYSQIPKTKLKYNIGI